MKKFKKYKKVLSTLSVIFSAVGASILISVLLFQPRSNNFLDIDHVLQFGVLLCIFGTVTGLLTHKFSKSLIAIVIGLAGIIGFCLFAFYVLTSGA